MQKKTVSNQMFSEELLKRATLQPDKPTWLRRLIIWWRRIIGRDRYYIGNDPGNGDNGAWCVIKRDTKTGTLTVVECGKYIKSGVMKGC